jgi:hypothetical protein
MRPPLNIVLYLQLNQYAQFYFLQLTKNHHRH